MVVFALENYERMGTELIEGIPKSLLGDFQARRFENCEIYIRLATKVRSEHCILLGSIAPPDEQMLFALLLAHTLKKEGAVRVTAIFPYLAYSRHDKDKPGESLATAWAGRLLQAAGIDQTITVDSHSSSDAVLFPIPLISISSAPLFAQAIQQHGLSSTTLVAPDHGAIPRCHALQEIAGMADRGSIPYLEKQRTEAGIVHMGLHGSVSKRALLIDDILDTGETLLSAACHLCDAGVQEIDVMVTHGLFTGSRWKDLSQFGVRRIFCTNTVTVDATSGDLEIVRLSVIPLLREKLAGL